MTGLFDFFPFGGAFRACYAPEKHPHGGVKRVTVARRKNKDKKTQLEPESNLVFFVFFLAFDLLRGHRASILAPLRVNRP